MVYILVTSSSKCYVVIALGMIYAMLTPFTVQSNRFLQAPREIQHNLGINFTEYTQEQKVFTRQPPCFWVHRTWNK